MHMGTVLATLIEAISTIVGKSVMGVWQYPLAMDKWLELVIGPKQIILGLAIDTN
jgi:hypothetical protein